MGKNSSWADGTERVLPTARLARFVWNGHTLDLPDPLVAITYEESPISGANTVASGIREVLWEREENVCVITTEWMIPEVWGRLRRMLREWVGRGETAEVYVDRQMRACWMFDDGDVFDNNGGNPFRGNAALTFADLTYGSGVTMPSSGILGAALVCTLPGGSGNHFFSAAEGTLVLYFKPSYAGNDSAEHVILDCAVLADQGKNRLLIKKRADNLLHIIYYGANGAATILEQSVSWSADTEHTLMVQWKALSDLKAKLDTTDITTKKYYHKYGNTRKYGNTTKYGQVSGSSASGNEQVMAVDPDTVTLGIDQTATMGRSTGAFGSLTAYSLIYGLPDILKRFTHPLRTYYPKADFIDAAFRPVRPSPGGQEGVELYYYTLRIRDGR